MSNIKITDKIKDKAPVQYTVGQYYRDRTSGAAYFLVKHSNFEPAEHSLICLRDGRPYSSERAQKPIGAFCGDEADFDLIENVEIVLS